MAVPKTGKLALLMFHEQRLDYQRKLTSEVLSDTAIPREEAFISLVNQMTIMDALGALLHTAKEEV